MKSKGELHYFFIAVMISISFWSFGSVMEVYSVRIDGTVNWLWVKTRFTGLILVPPLLFMNATVFSRGKAVFNWKTISVFVIPMMSLVLIWTNDYHQLFYKTYSIINTGSVFGEYFWVHVIYSYILTGISIGLLLHFSIKNFGLFSRQVSLIILGIGIVVFPNILMTFGIFELPTYINVITFNGTAICVFLAIFKFNFLNILPIALQKVVDSMADGFVVVNNKLEVLEYNRAIVRFFFPVLQIKRGERLDHLLQKSTLPVDHERFIKLLKKMMKHCRSTSFKEKFYTENINKYFSVDINAIQSKGKSYGAVILIRDITRQMETIETLEQEIVKRKEIETNLQKAIEKAETANRTKSEFLANMSHELRTPLNAILGFSELMRRESSITNEQRANLRTIGRSGEHLLSLINDVLEFSKIEAGRIVLNKENFDLHNLLLGLEEMFRLRARQKDLSLDLERGTGVPQYIRADQSKLRQILINLLGNAVKFTQKGGIILRVVKKKPGRQKQNGKCSLFFEVIDTGLGISPLEQEKIFDAFFQTDNRDLSHQGTGLGLTISQTFVNLMGGVLGVDSKLGKGTRFSFDIPIELVDGSNAESFKHTPRVIGLESGQPRFRLLVADDNNDNRNLLVKLLRTVKFDVRDALNGQEAFRIWKKWRPHLIWMDMRMPIMDGYQATTQIKESLGGKDTIIVALTASAFEEDRNKVIEHGCDDFVRKPYKEHEIFEMIKKHLSVRYVYEEGEERLGAAVTVEMISDEDLITLIKDLPEKRILRLEEATELSDATLIDEVIEEIRSENAQLAEALSEVAGNFAYDKILVLVQKAKETITDQNP